MTEMTCKKANTVKIEFRTLNPEKGTALYERAVVRGVNFNPFYRDMSVRTIHDLGHPEPVTVVREFSRDWELQSITVYLADIEILDNLYFVWGVKPSTYTETKETENGYTEIVGWNPKNL